MVGNFIRTGDTSDMTLAVLVLKILFWNSMASALPPPRSGPCVDTTTIQNLAIFEVGAHWLLLQQQWIPASASSPDGMRDQRYVLLDTQSMKIREQKVPFSGFQAQLRSRLVNEQTSWKNSAGEEYPTWSPRLLFVSGDGETYGFMVENMGNAPSTLRRHFMAFWHTSGATLVLSENIQEYPESDYSWSTSFLGIDSKERLFLARNHQLARPTGGPLFVDVQPLRIETKSGQLKPLPAWKIGPLRDPSSSLRRAGLAAGGTLLAVAEYGEHQDSDLKLRLIDTETGETKYTVTAPPATYGSSVSDDLKFIYSPSAITHRVEVRELSTGKLVRKIPLNGRAHYVQLTPDGRNLRVLVNGKPSSIQTFAEGAQKPALTLGKNEIFGPSAPGLLEVSGSQTSGNGALVASLYDRDKNQVSQICRIQDPRP